jgi:hypothetical protein
MSNITLSDSPASSDQGYCASAQHAGIVQLVEASAVKKLAIS